MLCVQLSVPSLVIGRAPATRSAAVSMTEGNAPDVIAKYKSLVVPAGKIQAEYLWIDAEGEVRSKARTIETKGGAGVKISDLPDWNSGANLRPTPRQWPEPL